MQKGQHFKLDKKGNTPKPNVIRVIPFLRKVRANDTESNSNNLAKSSLDQLSTIIRAQTLNGSQLLCIVGHTPYAAAPQLEMKRLYKCRLMDDSAGASNKKHQETGNYRATAYSS